MGLSVVSERRSPPTSDPSPARNRLLNPRRDPIRLTRLDQRAHLGLKPKRVADPQRTNARREPVQERGFDVGVDEDALGRHANLSGVVVAALDHRLDDAVEIGAAVHDSGRDAPMLQGRAGSGRELVVQGPAHPRRADEAQEGDTRIGRKPLGEVVALGMKVWHHGSGRPASCTSATKSRQESGVALAGLTITGQPTAIAGTT